MYSKIRNTCIILTVILVAIGLGLHFDTIRQKKLAERIKYEKIVIPLDEMDRLEPRRTAKKGFNEESPTYRFLIYTDSLNCSACKIKSMASWNRFIENTWEKDINMDFLFIFSPKSDRYEETREAFVYSHFFHPMYLDRQRALLRCNKLLRERANLRSVVIDTCGRILFVGDPTMNEKTEVHYLDFIQTISSSTQQADQI